MVTQTVLRALELDNLASGQCTPVFAGSLLTVAAAISTSFAFATLFDTELGGVPDAAGNRAAIEVSEPGFDTGALWDASDLMLLSFTLRNVHARCKEQRSCSVFIFSGVLKRFNI
jgi:hypothetical protein